MLKSYLKPGTYLFGAKGKPIGPGIKTDDINAPVGLNGRAVTFNDVLVCSTFGNIYAISKTDGSRYWRQTYPAKGSPQPIAIVSIFITEQGNVIAGANGSVVCFDLFTGRIKWKNMMKGMGYHEVGVVSTGIQSMQPTATDLVPNAPPTYNQSTGNERQILFGFTQGKVMALDPETGATLWQFDCPSGGYKMPTVLVEPYEYGSAQWPFQVVFVGSGRMVYCLRASTGKLLWSTIVSNSYAEKGYMSLSTPYASRFSAFSHVNLSAMPHAQTFDYQQTDEGRRVMQRTRGRD
ncbi:hypothetical protein BC940DRAFT_279635 [Gongronella butleri]|nr:hypothetical protein BC940DRAFT_279635 [Gongronella butleri]